MTAMILFAKLATTDRCPLTAYLLLLGITACHVGRTELTRSSMTWLVTSNYVLNTHLMQLQIHNAAWPWHDFAVSVSVSCIFFKSWQTQAAQCPHGWSRHGVWQLICQEHSASSLRPVESSRWTCSAMCFSATRVMASRSLALTLDTEWLRLRL